MNGQKKYRFVAGAALFVAAAVAIGCCSWPVLLAIAIVAAIAVAGVLCDVLGVYTAFVSRVLSALWFA